ncbi:MAG: hypothetical protein ACOXZW_01940 [Bacilli bacterium]|jgi:hypothetical protein|nr:hypothetical protein [Bacilli bacterium]
MDMRKPSLFVNPIVKKITNSQQLFYSKHQDTKTQKLKTKASVNKITTNIEKFTAQSIDEKINSLLELPKYLYDLDLEIVTNAENVITKIIGKNKTHLITTDNKLIPIVDIVDIKVKK